MFVRGLTSGFLGGAGGGASVELTSDGGGVSGPGGACAFPSHAQIRHAPLTATTLPNGLIFVTFLRLELPDYLLTASHATGQKFPPCSLSTLLGFFPPAIGCLVPNMILACRSCFWNPRTPLVPPPVNAPCTCVAATGGMRRAPLGFRTRPKAAIQCQPMLQRWSRCSRQVPSRAKRGTCFFNALYALHSSHSFKSVARSSSPSAPNSRNFFARSR